MLDLTRSRKQAKSFSAKSIMKNYKLSSLLSDAMSSPVGSTQRKRASALLKSLRTMRENNNYRNGRIVMSQMNSMAEPEDGKGGPGPSSYLPNVGSGGLSIDQLAGTPNPMQIPGITTSGSYSYNDLQNFIGSIPQFQGMPIKTPMITTGWSGASSPEKLTNTLGSPTAPTKPSLTPLNSGPKTVWDMLNSQNITVDFGLTQKQQTKGQYVPINPSYNDGGMIGEEMVLNKLTNKLEPRFDYKNGAFVDKLGQLTGDIRVGFDKTTTTKPGISTGTQTQTQTPQVVDLKSILSTYPKEFSDYINSISGKATFPLDKASVGQLYEQWQQSRSGQWVSNPPTDISEGESVQLGGNVPPEIANWYSNWYNSLDSDDQERYSTLYKSINSGIGPDAFAYLVMSDRDELHRLFPDVPLDELPMGASLARQVVDLKSRVKDELGLNQLETKMNEIQSRGYTLLPTLTDYISGRDEYLGKIDKMIADTKTKMVDMDLSDPTLRKSMSDYTNYLYVLKGRQNKRYGDWLQQSIDAHNAEATRLLDQYKVVSARYQDEVANQGAIMEEDYNNWKSTLTGLYNSIDGMEQKELETETMRAELQQTYLKMAIDAAGSNSDQLDQSYLTDKDKYFDIIGGVKQDAVGPIGADGKPTNIYSERARDIEGMMAQAEAAGLDPRGVIYWMTNSYIPSYVQNEVSGGNIDEPIKFYSDIIKNFATTSTRPSALEDASTLANVLISATDTGLNSYLNQEGIRDSLREVLDDLVGTRFWSGKPKYDSADSREEFKQNNSGKLTDSLLDKLWDTYETNVIGAGASPSDLYNTTLKDDELISQVSKNISSVLRASVFSQ